MAIKINPSITKQQEIIRYVSDTFDSYKLALEPYFKRMLEVYKEYSTFEQERSADWKMTFKVNKAHEVVNKILPRIMSKNPKWIVSSKPDMLLEVDTIEDEQQKTKRLQSLTQQTQAIRDYLSTAFDKYNLIGPARLWAKNMIIYGNAFAKIKFKYEIGRTEDKGKDEEVTMDEMGNQVIIPKDKVIKEYVVNQYPTIDVKSWTEIVYDPRYKAFGDLPAIIEVTTGVRLGELKRNKKYINIDKIEELPAKGEFIKDSVGYKERVQAITGMNTQTMTEGVDKDSMTMKTYYGLYEYKSGDERLYKISIINELILVCIEEITQMPFELIRCFEDTETLLSRGFVEPMMGIQKSMNFKKNSVSEYMNMSLNRSYIWNPNSGINPKDLINRPGAIIPTNKTLDQVDANFREVAYRDINPGYFQEGNDQERQIQAVTFTVDTSNPNNQQALTNTATGARIKMFESNTVIEGIRKQREKGLENLAYKLLEETVDNIEENLVIKKIGDSGFREINKEALKEAIKKYEIKVEIGSSSFDSIEDRRDEATAKFNMAKEAVAMGVPIDLKLLRVDIMNTFEGIDAKSYLQAPDIAQMMGGGMPAMGGGELQPPQPQGSEAAQVTEQVAQGGLTTGL